MLLPCIHKSREKKNLAPNKSNGREEPWECGSVARCYLACTRGYAGTPEYKKEGGGNEQVWRRANCHECQVCHEQTGLDFHLCLGIPIIPTLWRLGQEYPEFEACLKTNKKKSGRLSSNSTLLFLLI
jgi:hypothetical protein